MRRLTFNAVVLISILFAASFYLFIGINGQQCPTRADSITIEPDPSDPLSQTGSPIKHGEPGNDVVFTIWVKNDHDLEQRVLLTVLDGPSWLIAVTGSVDVPSGTSVEATVVISIPDDVLDPDENYAILIEGMGNITGDKDSLLLIVELDIAIDHDLVLLPYNTDTWTFKVYPGERTFVDISLTNLGNMKGNYDLEILEHISDWDVQFREDEESVTVQLDHGETGSEYRTRVMIGVPASSSPGETILLTIRSISVEADEFSTGTLYDEVFLTMEVIKGSMVTISPLKTLSKGDDFVDVTYELHHSGVVDAVLDFLPIIYQDERIQTGWDFLIAPESPLIVKIGEIKEVRMRITVPDRAFGYYDLKLDAVSNNADIIPGESIIYISPISDITISSLDGGPFDEGDNVTLITEVSNNGDLGRQALLDIEGVPEDYLLDVDPSMDLYIEAGSSVVVKITLYPNRDELEEPFMITLTVESPDDEISGQWVPVAQTFMNISYRDLPNIEVRRIFLSTEAIQEGEEIYVNVTIANIGNSLVDSVELTLYEITYSLSNNMVDNRSLSLAIGDVETLSFKWIATIYTKSLRATAVTYFQNPDIQELKTEDNDLRKDVWVRVQDRNDTISAAGEDGIFTPESAAVGGMGLGIIGALLVFFGSKDVFRYPFFLALGPLYSKLKPEHLLNNRLRKRIYVFVQNHPGEHFRSILTHLNLTNGTLAHHLYTLEKENLIRSQRDGLYRRFYPAGYQIDPTKVSLTAIQQRIIDLVNDEPGLSQKEISQNLELSNSTVNYNIKSMKEKGLLEVRKDGKSTRIFPSKDTNA